MLQTTYSPSKLTSTSQMLSPPSRSRSPIKTVTSTRSTTYHDDKEDGTKEQSQETYNREVTEKKTTIVDEPKVSGNKETFKKTTITEKEETIQKTEILKFTQIGCPSTETTDIDPLKFFEERRNQRRNERATGGVTSAFTSNKDASNNRTSVTKTVKFGDGGSQKMSDFNQSNKSSIGNLNATKDKDEEIDSRKLGSPSKFGSCRDRSNSPSKRDRRSTASNGVSISSPTKVQLLPN